jgi:hypothetical protein
MKILIMTSVLVLFCALTATAQILSDDFNDGVPDTTKWIIGTGFSNDAINYDPTIVTSSEASGSLVFTHPGSYPFWKANAYESRAVFDMSGRRASALLDASGGAHAWLAVGQDSNHFARIAAMAGADGSLFAQCDFWDGNKQSHVVCVPPADYSAQTAYLAIRIQGNKVFYESSPDGATWTTRLTLNAPGAGFFNSSRIEVGGGMFKPDAGAVTGTVDDVKVEP